MGETAETGSDLSYAVATETDTCRHFGVLFTK